MGSLWVEQKTHNSDKYFFSLPPMKSARNINIHRVRIVNIKRKINFYHFSSQRESFFCCFFMFSVQTSIINQITIIFIVRLLFAFSLQATKSLIFLLLLSIFVTIRFVNCFFYELDLRSTDKVARHINWQLNTDLNFYKCDFLAFWFFTFLAKLTKILGSCSN